MRLKVWCKNCNVIMSITGTTYQKKKNNHDKGYKRYNKCPKCGDKVYNNSPNFQEVLSVEIERSNR